MEDHKNSQEYEQMERYRNQTLKNEDIPENGIHITYFIDDSNDISQKKCSEGHYKNWKLHGLQKTWYETGELLSESNFNNGLLDGKSITWHKNGQKKSEGTYNSKVYFPDGTRSKVYEPDGSFQPKSALDGPFNEWHENGKLKRSGLYLNGLKHYTWKEWNDKGELINSEWNHVF